MICEIVSNRVLVKLLEKEKNETKKERLFNDLKQSAALRAKRAIAYNYRGVQTQIERKNRRLREKNIHFYDCEESHDLPLKTWFEMNELYPKKKSVPKQKLVSQKEIDNMSAMYDFWHNRFKRESFDAQSAVVKYYANYGKDYDNAFWDGENLVFGLGDPSYFNPFGNFVDIQGHEFGHAILQYEADFVYAYQPGALNEHVADVFGITVKHYLAGNSSNWLLAEGLWREGGRYKALRNMLNPGTAYPEDDQPSHMSNAYYGQEDNGGVHINSGIPNRAFADFASRLGGNSWDAPLDIWYHTIKDQRRTNKQTEFGAFAIDTYHMAKKKYGDKEADLLRNCWNGVGLIF